MPNTLVFSGNACPDLARSIAGYLGLTLSRVQAGRFSDGEVQVQILESVRGKNIFLVQSTCPPAENLIELLAMIDGLKRASARRVTVVIPYLGYSRQDRRIGGARAPITAKVMAKMIAVAGADHVLTVDLHADQIQGFFDIPVDNVYASPVLVGDVWRNRDGTTDHMVVSPDVGGVVRARAFAKQLDDAELAIIDKRRPSTNVSQVMNIIGDVAGKDCLVVDDIVDTAGTLCKAADALKEFGARSVRAYITHPVLSGPAVDNIDASVLDELVVTDTIPLSEGARGCARIRVLSTAELLGETIRRISFDDSVSELVLD
ncbi:MAG: ribose-phosphate pyrophosphokinase [Gammaproteobacteria bacterium]|nr:ribose-phosphate pyrophosphokinase [Gammaproteobacteria bacterium]